MYLFPTETANNDVYLIRMILPSVIVEEILTSGFFENHRFLLSWYHLFSCLELILMIRKHENCRKIICFICIWRNFNKLISFIGSLSLLNRKKTCSQSNSSMGDISFGLEFGFVVGFFNTYDSFLN